MDKNRLTALVAVFIVQLLYGLNFTFANDVIDGGYIKPFGFILLRIFAAACLFWFFSLFTPKEKIEKKDFIKLFIASIFGIATNMLLFFKGFEYTTPIHASVIMIVTPIIVLILSGFFLNERITPPKLLGVLLGFAGAIVLSVYGKSTQAGDNILLGNLFVFLNAVSYSIYLVMIKKLTDKYHPLAFIKWLFLFGFFLVIPFGYNDLMAVQWHTFNNYIIFCVVFVIIGATFLTYLLNPIGLRHLRASTVSSFLYLQPVVAVIFSILMKSDSFDTVKFIASILIFGGVYLATLRPKLK
ncbi:MAG: DMT family transporter [Flavobacteriaceae bacterium]|nr:DMT family transporter [Mangrovimonas sp.]MCB0434650.1 DMT family transporter [Mangrovimonas sp.]HRV54814.1 DMT family transporter [Mangrovimonas sp.]